MHIERTRKMARVESIDQAIEYLDGKKCNGDMSTDDAIMLTGRRQGRPEEDDWDLVEAAEVLSREVLDLRRQVDRVTELEIFLTSIEANLRHLARSHRGTSLTRMAMEIRTFLDQK